MINLYIFIINI